MSEYETTDLGGDPVEFEFVEGGTYERGVIRSTADRQQIRRDAEAAAAWMPDLPWAESRHCHPAGLREIIGEGELSHSPSEAFCDAVTPHVVLARLNELEQAEVHAAWHAEDAANRIAVAEARLANVPPLISFLRTVLDERLLPPRSDDEARDLLAAWDDQ